MHDSSTPETAPGGSEEPEDAEVPLNRAERRARSRGRKPADPKGKGRITGHQNMGTGPRQWTNRRGGG